MIIMRTFSGSEVGRFLEPILWNAKESVWVCSPWIGKEYMEKLVELSRQGIDIRIITSNVDYNQPAITLIKAREHPNFSFIVLDQEQGKFIHSKIYVADNERAVTGSANLTYSGLHSNDETVHVTENVEEAHEVQRNFMELWLKYEKAGVKREALAAEPSKYVKNALPLNFAYSSIPGIIDTITKGLSTLPGKHKKVTITNVKLNYYPYYYFEYIFRGAVQIPVLVWEDKGSCMIDGVERVPCESSIVLNDLSIYPLKDYPVPVDEKISTFITPSKISSDREALTLAIDYVVRKNTRQYDKPYYDRTYPRVYIPNKRDITIVKGQNVHVPLWHIQFEMGGSSYNTTILGSSGTVWQTKFTCPECSGEYDTCFSHICQICGKKVCFNCIKTSGFIRKKELCSECKGQSFQIGTKS